MCKRSFILFRVIPLKTFASHVICKPLHYKTVTTHPSSVSRGGPVSIKIRTSVFNSFSVIGENMDFCGRHRSRSEGRFIAVRSLMYHIRLFKISFCLCGLYIAAIYVGFNNGALEDLSENNILDWKRNLLPIT